MWHYYQEEAQLKPPASVGVSNLIPAHETEHGEQGPSKISNSLHGVANRNFIQFRSEGHRTRRATRINSRKQISEIANAHITANRVRIVRQGKQIEEVV